MKNMKINDDDDEEDQYEEDNTQMQKFEVNALSLYNTPLKLHNAKASKYKALKK